MVQHRMKIVELIFFCEAKNWKSESESEEKKKYRFHILVYNNILWKKSENTSKSVSLYNPAIAYISVAMRLKNIYCACILVVCSINTPMHFIIFNIIGYRFAWIEIELISKMMQSLCSMHRGMHPQKCLCLGYSTSLLNFLKSLRGFSMIINQSLHISWMNYNNLKFQ